LQVNSIYIAKFDEPEIGIPTMSEVKNMYPGLSFDPAEMKLTEVKIVKLLKYDLSFPTAYHYLQIFLAFGIVFTDDCYVVKGNSLPLDKTIVENVYSKCIEILDSLSLDEKFDFNLTICSVLLAREQLKLEKKWSNNFDVLYGFKVDDILMDFERLKK
jgi:hypothetical protein